MNEKQTPSEAAGFRCELPDRYDPIAADLSSFGMGNFQDFQRHLVFPLQSHFQAPLHWDDGSGDLPAETGKSPLRFTLHAQLLDLFLEFAGALRFAFGKCPMPEFFFRRHR